MLIAVDIKTADWNRITDYLIQDRWKCKYKYNGFDAGIDFDLLLFEKQGEQIFLGWGNWFEGEIKCTEARLKQLEKSLHFSYKYGEPENLKLDIIERHIKG